MLYNSPLRNKIEEHLRPADEAAPRYYPQDDGSRPPIHSVYLRGDKYTPQTPAQWGQIALDAVNEAGGMSHLLGVHGLVRDPKEAQLIADKVEAKLATEPIEDLRLDFEHGYGAHTDEDEDAAVITAAKRL